MTHAAYLRFYNMETGEYTKEFQEFYDDVGQYDCPNYDCNQVANAILDGMTAYEAAKLFNQLAEENKIPIDFEDQLNHDMSMNY
jgi:hypothetical protein